jgi:hypothetical protein
MNDDAFWERVNAALDERRDPLEDPQIQRELDASPERLDELELLLRTAGALGQARPLARRGRVAKALLVAGAAAVLALALHLLWNAPSRSSEHFAGAVGASADAADLAGSAAAPFVLEPCIALLDLRATFTHRTPDEIREVRFDALSDTYSQELRRRTVDGPAVSFSVDVVRTSPSHP